MPKIKQLPRVLLERQALAGQLTRIRKNGYRNFSMRTHMRTHTGAVKPARRLVALAMKGN